MNSRGMAVSGTTRAVFLDRDGVLIEDRQPLRSSAAIATLPGVARALRRLKRAGFALVVVSNQTVVARGLLSIDDVCALQGEVEARLRAAGAPPLDGFYFCPHHPAATLPAFRRTCACRKPAPGLLHEARAALNIDLAGSFMVGDRPSDVVAGQRAGCRTIQLLTGRHLDPLIEVEGGFAPTLPDFCCTNLADAADLILAVPTMAQPPGAGTRLGAGARP
jgi:D-glycero-D-manno-heptose 1,7-bisphosphate phosphatase